MYDLLFITTINHVIMYNCLLTAVNNGTKDATDNSSIHCDQQQNGKPH